ncbi:hypothetical protein GPJ56_003601 [Histomonas meleagridis]|uniref:uncharacterized protein n=1 Tax=Histomonas meleagridis TaxID=135588 RepID=UPI00355A060D|nr:hypothetical protein GPJ56_003601 [Histomonas meleagridis]KAH0800671.1 hypothetical protein GO595_006424 [Histomonas meleagridis]
MDRGRAPMQKTYGRYQPPQHLPQKPPQHVIKVERNSNKTITTPFSIGMSQSFRVQKKQELIVEKRPPSKQVPLFHNFPVSASLSNLSSLSEKRQINDKKSKGNNAHAQKPEKKPYLPIKDVYSVEDILLLQPKNQPQKKITSPGFLIFLNLFDQKKKNRNNGKRNNNKSKRDKNKQKVQQRLVEHESGRFVGSALAKECGLYDENSIDSLKSQAQIWINRLNPGNMKEVQDNIVGLHLSWDIIVDLFLDLATANSEFPERNPQLGSLIRLAIQLSQENQEFKQTLVDRSLQAGFRLNSLKQVPVGSLQSIISWNGCLFTSGLITKYQINDYFNDVIDKQSLEMAIEVLRTGMYICGKAFDESAPEIGETFFTFLDENRSNRGHVKFLVSELFSLRANKWNTNLIIKNGSVTKKPLLVVKKSPSINLQSFDDVDNSQSIEFGYLHNLKEPPQGMIPQTLVRVCFNSLPHHLKSDYGYAQYVSDLFINSKMENSLLTSLLKRETNNYCKIVQDEENPTLWGILYMVYAFLYSNKTISLDFMINTYLNIPKNCYNLSHDKFIYKIAEVTGIPLSEVEQFPTIFNDNSSDFIDSLVTISDPIEDIENVEICSEIAAAVFVRCLFDDAFQEEEPIFEEVFLPHKEKLVTLMDKYPEAINRNVEFTLETGEMNEEQINLVKSFFVK